MIPRIATYATIANDLPNNEVEKVINIKHGSLYLESLKKGRKLMNLRIKFGYTGDDFIKNNISVVLEYDAYKIPRFMNPLHNKALFKK